MEELESSIALATGKDGKLNRWKFLSICRESERYAQEILTKVILVLTTSSSSSTVFKCLKLLEYVIEKGSREFVKLSTQKIGTIKKFKNYVVSKRGTHGEVEGLSGSEISKKVQNVAVRTIEVILRREQDVLREEKESHELMTLSTKVENPSDEESDEYEEDGEEKAFTYNEVGEKVLITNSEKGNRTTKRKKKRRKKKKEKKMFRKTSTRMTNVKKIGRTVLASKEYKYTKKKEDGEDTKTKKQDDEAGEVVDSKYSHAGIENPRLSTKKKKAKSGIESSSSKDSTKKEEEVKKKVLELVRDENGNIVEPKKEGIVKKMINFTASIFKKKSPYGKNDQLITESVSVISKTPITGDFLSTTNLTVDPSGKYEEKVVNEFTRICGVKLAPTTLEVSRFVSSASNLNLKTIAAKLDEKLESDNKFNEKIRALFAIEALMEKEFSVIVNYFKENQDNLQECIESDVDGITEKAEEIVKDFIDEEEEEHEDLISFEVDNKDEEDDSTGMFDGMQVLDDEAEEKKKTKKKKKKKKDEFSILDFFD